MNIDMYRYENTEIERYLLKREKSALGNNFSFRYL